MTGLAISSIGQTKRVKELSADTPLKKLTVGLIETYLRIGDVHFQVKQRIRGPASNLTPGNGIGCRLFNGGYDDANYNYKLKIGETWANRYLIVKVLGKGSFGQVVEAVDMEYKRSVAIKIIKNRKAFFNQALIEISILKLLNESDPMDNKHIVRYLGSFTHRNHLCLTYELLSVNLYELLRNTSFQGISLIVVRSFGFQILETLAHLSDKDIGVIHCDLKPENVLLMNPREDRLKVVDFGSSCFLKERIYTYIQSRFYRAPEILLGYPYDVEIDMWSLGCMLVELHTGYPLFNGVNEHDQLCRIVELLGNPPDSMLKSSSQEKISRFFTKCDSSTSMSDVKSRYQLLYAKTYKPRQQPQNLWDIIYSGQRNNRNEQATCSNINEIAIEYEQFVDLIMRMLVFEPEKRIRPAEALKHPFFRYTRGTSTVTRRSKRVQRLQEVKNSMDSVLSGAGLNKLQI